MCIIWPFANTLQSRKTTFHCTASSALMRYYNKTCKRFNILLLFIITYHLYSAAKCKKRHTAMKIKVQYMKMNEIIEIPKLVCSGIK